MTETAHPTIYRKEYQVPPYLVDEVSLTFILGDKECVVHAQTSLKKNEAYQGAAPLFLNGRDLELLSLAIDNRELEPQAYVKDKDGLTIHDVPDSFVLQTTTRIYPDANTALEGLYRSSGNFCTQCEAEGFRKPRSH